MGGRHCLVATMKLLLLVFVISSAAALETYTETRDITDSAGSTFSCLYTIVYDVSRKVVYRKQSTVQCNPDTNGKQTTEDIIIAAAGMSVAVTYQPRTGKTGIKKTVVSDYTAPTTTAAPTTAAPAAPAATGAPATGGSSMTMEGVMDCTCMPNMTAMMEELMKPPTEEEMAEMEQAWTEMMSSMMSEEEMAQMEQAWMDWETQMEAEWKANGGLMGIMGMTGDDMKMMMQMMEMKAHCQCTSSNVAYGQMAMPTMMAPAGRKLA